MNETITTLQSRWKSPVAWASLLIKVVGILMFAGKITVAPASSGVATIDFDIVDPGTYVVKTAMPEVANGEVTINV